MFDWQFFSVLSVPPWWKLFDAKVKVFGAKVKVFDAKKATTETRRTRRLGEAAKL